MHWRRYWLPWRTTPPQHGRRPIYGRSPPFLPIYPSHRLIFSKHGIQDAATNAPGGNFFAPYITRLSWGGKSVETLTAMKQIPNLEKLLISCGVSHFNVGWIYQFSGHQRRFICCRATVLGIFWDLYGSRSPCNRVDIPLQVRCSSACSWL